MKPQDRQGPGEHCAQGGPRGHVWELVADSLPQRVRRGEPQAVSTGPWVLGKVPVPFPCSLLGEGLPAEASVPLPEP